MNAKAKHEKENPCIVMAEGRATEKVAFLTEKVAFLTTLIPLLFVSPILFYKTVTIIV